MDRAAWGPVRQGGERSQAGWKGASCASLHHQGRRMTICRGLLNSAKSRLVKPEIKGTEPRPQAWLLFFGMVGWGRFGSTLEIWERWGPEQSTAFRVGQAGV